MIQVEKIADGSNDVFLGYMPGHQVILVLPEHGDQIVLLRLLILFQNFHEDIITHLFVDASSGRIEINIPGNINSEVSQPLQACLQSPHEPHWFLNSESSMPFPR